MLQNENFIHVSDRRRTAPQSASATQKPDHTPLASSVQAEAYHDIPNGRTELPPDHWKKQAFARDGYQEVYEVTPTTVAKQREEHWVNLSNAFMGEENENDLWLSYGIDESWQQRLERNKRDLTAGSGTQTGEMSYLHCLCIRSVYVFININEYRSARLSLVFLSQY